MRAIRSLETATWDDITELQPRHTLTPIEHFADPDRLPPLQRHWREHGWVVLDNLIPDEVLDAYSAARRELPDDRGAKDNYYGGWADPTPYLRVPSLMNLATHHTLMHNLNALIGELMAVHLTLTGWVSTERHWHQDSYLNPGYVWSWYAAAWIALDDISPDAGPFQFVDGSHLWPVMRQDKIFKLLSPAEGADHAWPSKTQQDIARICDEEIARRGGTIASFVPKRGQVLIWHSNLMHRGSVPKDPTLERRAVICHYSAITQRLDFKRLARCEETSQLYFDFPSGDAPTMK